MYRYRFSDSRGSTGVEYYVNFCSNITKSPSDACLNQNGTFIGGSAVQDFYGKCMILGYDWNKATFGFEDVTDPTKGVTVTQLGDGDKCGAIKNRTLVIHIQCTDNYVVPHDTPVVESSCTYHMYISTIFSCPLSCGISNRHLCGNQGSCHFDKDSRRAHCYCNEGYYGKDCSYHGNETTNMGATEYVLLVLFIFEILIFILMYIYTYIYILLIISLLESLYGWK